MRLTVRTFGLVLFFAVLLVAFPRLRNHIGVHELDAVRSLVEINSLEKQYAISHPDKGFACELGVLREQGSETDVSGQISKLLQRSGYKFEFSRCITGANVTVTGYQIFAIPIGPDRTRIRAFCTDQTGKLFYDPDGSGPECLALRREIL